MIKAIRETIELAQTEGLKLVEVEVASRHTFLLFKNSHGAVMRKPMSRGMGNNWQDVLNAKAQFKRFARGQYHGLQVKEIA